MHGEYGNGASSDGKGHDPPEGSEQLFSKHVYPCPLHSTKNSIARPAFRPSTVGLKSKETGHHVHWPL